MPEKKVSQKKLQITFATLITGFLFVIELYAMINLPKNFIVIGIVGVLMLGSLYFVIAGIMGLMQLKNEREEEQYDSIFKSEKASYLLLKKYFEDIEDKLVALAAASKVPTEEIIEAQKGIGKVIINRSRENAEAMLRSNELLTEQVTAMEEMLRGNNSALVDSYRGISDEQLQKMMLRQQELLMELKDMEIRIDNAIMQSTKVIAAPVVAAAPTGDEGIAFEEPVFEEPVAEEPVVEESVVEEPVAEESVAEEPVVEESVVEEPVVEESVVEEPVVDEVAVEEPVVEEPVVDEVAVEEPVVEEPVAEEPVVEEEVAEEPVAPDLSDPNKMMSPDDIAALLASVEETVVEENVGPDLSDPNKMMSPDDIAALLASVEETMEEEGIELPPEEPVAEEAPVEIPEETSVEEEASVGPDLSDPNKMMSPDDIAALLASMEEPTTEGDLALEELAIEEAEALEEDAEPDVAAASVAAGLDLSDPNKVMSPDDIAALLAAMDN